MKTLKGEMKRLSGHDAKWLIARIPFWSEYGDWRVVEGELVIATNQRGPLGEPPSQVWREVAVFDGEEYTKIGVVGDRVKLILPPEEKKGAAERMRCACAMFKSNAWTLNDCRRVWLGEVEEEPPTPILNLTKKLGYERARANRYETALREIADNHFYAGEVAHSMRNAARRALDDSA